MKQVYYNYLLWEDYQNGMWRKHPKQLEEQMCIDALEFMQDVERWGDAMIKVIKEWKYTTEHNLSDPQTNKKAFIGQCAVCYELGIPEHITREVWGKLTEKNQIEANNKAKKAISLFKLNHLEYELKTLFD
jgi:hypothetical protein